MKKLLTVFSIVLILGMSTMASIECSKAFYSVAKLEIRQGIGALFHK